LKIHFVKHFFEKNEPRGMNMSQFSTILNKHICILFNKIRSIWWKRIAFVTPSLSQRRPNRTNNQYLSIIFIYLIRIPGEAIFFAIKLRRFLIHQLINRIMLITNSTLSYTNATNTTNPLKCFLIGQFVKSFFLIGSSNASKYL